jgi:hypothetical protein
VYIYICVCMYVYTFVCVYIYLCVYVCIYVCVCIYIFVCVYVCTVYIVISYNFVLHFSASFDHNQYKITINNHIYNVVPVFLLISVWPFISNPLRNWFMNTMNIKRVLEMRAGTVLKIEIQSFYFWMPIKRILTRWNYIVMFLQLQILQHITYRVFLFISKLSRWWPCWRNVWLVDMTGQKNNNLGYITEKWEISAHYQHCWNSFTGHKPVYYHDIFNSQSLGI